MRNYKISVVVPAYNEEQYLAKCLCSLKAQDYEGDYEIIVVDNGSTDKTAEIARNFGAKVIPCQQKGVVYAREAGFRASSGEIVVQADADTTYPADWLSRIARHFSAHPEAVAVAGEVIYRASPTGARLLQTFRRIVNNLSFRLCRKAAFCLASSFAFRREALLRSGGYNTELPFVGDEQDLMARLSKSGRIVYDRHLLAVTSSRRFSGRLWRFIIVDMFYHTIIEQVLYGITGKSLTGGRACPRGEYRRRPVYVTRWAWSLAASILIGVLCWSYFSPVSDVYGKVYDRVASKQKVIALTFDDGPNEPYTSEILDILKSYDIKATFFAVGQNVEYYPEVAKRIVAEGHVLGNHSYTHRALSEFDSPDYSELDKAQKTIYQITGVKPRLFRPPYGRKTPWELDYVRRKGLITVTWSDSANDPNQRKTSDIGKRVLEDAHPGGIILLHDGNEIKHGSDRSRTVAALPQIIESLKAKGYTFVTIPELIKVAPYIEQGDR